MSLQRDMTGSFECLAVGLLSRFGKMSEKSPGASLTPGSPCFYPETQLDASLCHNPSAPANCLLPPHLLLLTFPVYKPSQGKTAGACMCLLSADKQLCQIITRVLFKYYASLVFCSSIINPEAEMVYSCSRRYYDYDRCYVINLVSLNYITRLLLFFLIFLLVSACSQDLIFVCCRI